MIFKEQNGADYQSAVFRLRRFEYFSHDNVLEKAERYGFLAGFYEAKLPFSGERVTDLFRVQVSPGQSGSHEMIQKRSPIK
jgi:hypothetical protein